MYKVHVANECRCFKKSSFIQDETFDDKADALMQAKILECRMNQEFCHTHYFVAEDLGDTIVLRHAERPGFDDDDDEDY